MGFLHPLSSHQYFRFALIMYHGFCRVQIRPAQLHERNEIFAVGQTNYIIKKYRLLGREFITITYSMVQSPSSEANWFAACQEIPRISRNPNVYYRTHKSPPPVSILGPPNPVHIPTSYLLEIHPNIIHPSTPRPPQWSLSLRLIRRSNKWTAIKISIICENILLNPFKICN